MNLSKFKLILAFTVFCLIGGGLVGIKIASDIRNNDQSLLKSSPPADSENTLGAATNSAPTPTESPLPTNV